MQMAFRTEHVCRPSTPGLSIRRAGCWAADYRSRQCRDCRANHYTFDEHAESYACAKMLLHALGHALQLRRYLLQARSGLDWSTPWAQWLPRQAHRYGWEKVRSSVFRFTADLF